MLAPARGAIERLIMLAPVVPASTGNGLSMRAELFHRAATAEMDVMVVVVPVAGHLPAGVPVRCAPVIVPPDPDDARAGIRSLIADATWRGRLARASPLPGLARSASPGLVDQVLRTLDSQTATGVHVVRSYLAPLGLAVAERTGARWATLDLDEDDAALAAALGHHEEADAYGRLLAAFAGSFDGVSMAAPAEAQTIRERHALAVELIPNAIDLPGDGPPRPDRRPGLSLLFVGNLTYAPNIEAVSVLATEVVPELRRRLDTELRLTVVGPHGASLEHLAGGQIELTGFVADLPSVYARADIVVAPLRVGGGTRIKLLEAFAFGVPVIASRVAASGLAVADGRHLLLAEDAAGFAESVERLLSAPDLAGQLVRQAHRLVREQYSTEVVMPLASQFFRRAAEEGRKPSN